MRQLPRRCRAWVDGVLRCYHGIRLYELPACPVEIHFDLPKLGLFSHLTLVAGAASRLGARGRPFTVRCFNDSYRGWRREDWFARLFADRDPAPPATAVVWLRRVPQTPTQWRGRRLAVEEAGRCFSKKFAVQPAIQVRVDEFVRNKFGSARMLALHYRGTDKVSEAPRASYDRVLACIHDRISRETFHRIFLATDESAFAEYLQRHAPIPVVLQPTAVRSTRGEALHLSGDGQGFRKAEEALIDCLLLSRCHGLIKTASALSAWAVIFNRSLEVDFINPPHPDTCYFPDSEILQQIAGRRALAAPGPAGS